MTSLKNCTRSLSLSRSNPCLTCSYAWHDMTWQLVSTSLWQPSHSHPSLLKAGLFLKLAFNSTILVLIRKSILVSSKLFCLKYSFLFMSSFLVPSNFVLESTSFYSSSSWFSRTAFFAKFSHSRISISLTIFFASWTSNLFQTAEMALGWTRAPEAVLLQNSFGCYPKFLLSCW